MYLSVKHLVAGFAVAVYAIVVWLSGIWLELTGNRLWALRIGLLAIGLVAIGAILWWLRLRKADKKAAGEPPESSAGSQALEEIDFLIRTAEAKLKSSKVQGARIGTLPAIFLIGAAGSGKTSAALNCGLEPEHLAGQLFQDGSLAPTESLNLWFARQATLLEAAGAILNDPGRWARLIRRIAPARLRSILGGSRQAPRAMVVCFDCETLTKSTSVDSIVATAKTLQARLREASELLGSSLPVYVLFTRADAIPFFAEYAGTLSHPEATQILGVTLPVQDYRTGLYVQDQTNRLTTAFERIFCSLSDHRAEYLAREQDPASLPGIYEFPREFRKLKGPLVQMLVELCRPSQLSAGPFLRGFYFTGVRMVLEEARPAAARPSRTPEPALAEMPEGATQIFDARQVQRGSSSRTQPEEVVGGATRVFDVRSLAGEEGTAAVGALDQADEPRWVPQWSFLSHIFGDLVLQDHAALGASGASSKVGFWRRFLLATATVFFVVCCVGFTVSFVQNRDLQEQVASAVKSASSLPELKAGQTPTTEQLTQLDRIRGPLEEVSDYERQGRPFFRRVGWGLNTGDLYSQACGAYASGFRRLLLGATQNTMAGYLIRLRRTASDSDPYDEPYTTLKAYLITTEPDDHKYSSTDLAPVLYTNWLGGRKLDRSIEGQVQNQFKFYSAELKNSVQIGDSDCFDGGTDQNAVGNARDYLRRFPAWQPAYQAVAAEDSKTFKPIDFNTLYPGSQKNVLAPAVVPGAFTQHGWDWMQTKLRDLGPYVHGESWVLGTSTTETPDLAALDAQVRQHYRDDFIDRWRKFLHTASFVSHHGDESKRLSDLTAGDSPLLNLFCTVTNNTSERDEDIQRVFGVAHAVVPTECSKKLLGQPNDDYVKALAQLQSCWSTYQAAPSDQKDSARQDCSKTEGVAEQAARSLAGAGRVPNSDPVVNNDVQRLLLAPIGLFTGKLQPPAGAGAKDLCAAITKLNAAFPSGTTLDEFQFVFGYGPTNLLDAHPPKSNPRYALFWKQADAIRRALYPNGSKTLQMQYKITALSTSTVKNYSLTIGTGTLTESNGPSKNFVWTGDPQEKIHLTANNVPAAPQSGSFDIFRFAAEGEAGRLVSGKYDFSIPVYAGTHPLPDSPRLNLSVDAGAANELFVSRSLGKLGCTADVGQ